MTAESLSALEEALRAHLATITPNAVLGDWFIAYASMRSDPDHESGIAHGIHYATSDSSPHGALGIAHLGVSSLTDDLSYPDEDDD